MAANAALVSLMHIIGHVRHHPRPRISFDEEQLRSLVHEVIFLQLFLELHSHAAGYTKEADPLETRIADAAYAAEDIIESHIVDQIMSGSTSTSRSQIGFYEGLQEVVEDMECIKKDAIAEINEKTRVQHQPKRESSLLAALLASASAGNNASMVGFDAVKLEIMDKLVGGQAALRVLPIVGMGGVGKTTLAKNVYEDKLVEYFDVRVWHTISQVYSMREILLKVLEGFGGCENQMNEYELGEKLRRSFWGRRYLVVMDDMWDIEAWEQLMLFFPDNHNGSRIMVTTRLTSLAFQVSGSLGIKLDLLDDDSGWELFCKTVSLVGDCSVELEEIGRRIARSCRGLPLSIIVIGGLLARSERTREYWEYIEENINSIVNLEENEWCLQILYMSYNSLPIRLKACFLYLGIFPEDSTIHASKLIKLWVAEGIINPVDRESLRNPNPMDVKSLEEIARTYITEFVVRNLISVEDCNDLGKIKSFKIHDLLRDLCSREARKHKFLCVRRLDIPPQELDTERRICITNQHIPKEEHLPQILHGLECAPNARSLLWEFEGPDSLPPMNLRLLRVSSVVNKIASAEEHDLEAILRQVNLRHIRFHLTYDSYLPYDTLHNFPSSLSLLWNLQTLIVTSRLIVSAPPEIWNMAQLRHVMCSELLLPDPSSDHIVLEKLQTLYRIYNFKCSEEVIKRICNVKNLKLIFDEKYIESLILLNNLGHLQKLESFHLRLLGGFDPETIGSHLAHNLTFLLSLKKLTLTYTYLHWEDLTTKIGSLPLLQVLNLRVYAVVGPEWETMEGQFCSLTFLIVSYCDLKWWTTEDTYFPRLQRLVLRGLRELMEIPPCIGDIPTLMLIEVDGCSDSVVESATRIREEQEGVGNEELQVYIS